jgi:hypothetical protein
MAEEWNHATNTIAPGSVPPQPHPCAGGHDFAAASQMPQVGPQWFVVMYCRRCGEIRSTRAV